MIKMTGRVKIFDDDGFSGVVSSVIVIGGFSMSSGGCTLRSGAQASCRVLSVAR